MDKEAVIGRSEAKPRVRGRPLGAIDATLIGRTPAGASALRRRAGDESVDRGLGAVVRGAAVVLVLFLAVPLVAMVWRAADGHGTLGPESLTTLRQALSLSLVTSSVTLAVIAVFGTPLAYLLARRPFRGARLVDTLVDLPIVLPPAVAGVALLMAFGRRGVVGRWLAELGVTIGFTTTAVVLAQLFVAAPFFVRAAKSGFARVDSDLEAAAADLGAPPLTVFLTVTLPLAWPGIAAGAVLAWARALGEFGATIMFAGNLPGVTQTMPLAIYARFGAGDLGTALLLSLVLLASSIVVLLGVRQFGSRPGGFYS